MPTCKKCNQQFSCRYNFEGKDRNLGNRKYCLTCSPFGGHNTRALHNGISYNEKLPTVQLRCTMCNREYDYHHDDPKGHTKIKCNSCLVNQRRFSIKRKSVDYLGGKCERCSYDKCLRALSFHHRNSSEKDFSVSGNHCHSWERIRTELDKCMLLCSNCHMEVHEEISKKE